MVRTGQQILEAIFTTAVSDELINAKFEQGRIGILFNVLAKEIEVWEGIIDYYNLESILTTATQEERIEQLAYPFYRRKLATPSKVILRFSRREPGTAEDIPIPENTIIESAGIDPIQYYTVQNKTIFTGQDFVDVLAYSYSSGTQSAVLAGELTIINSSTIGDVLVTNENPSWGGSNVESIESVRRKALQSRYERERGTEQAIRNTIRGYGFEDYDYALVDREHGNGSFSIYINISEDHVIEEIYDIVKLNKAFGVYLTCQKTKPFSFDFKFAVNIAGDRDLLPDERRGLKDALTTYFRDYVRYNGVGNKIIISKAVHYIYERILLEYNVSDIEIDVDSHIDKQDTKGNIVLASDEVALVNNISFTITVG